MKETVKAFAKRLPWGWRKLAAFLALHGGPYNLLIRRQPSHEGVYKSFDDVPGSTIAVQDNLARVAEYNANPPRLDEATGLPLLQQGHDLLPLVAAMVPKRPLRILDFGGAAGVDFQNFIRAMPADEISYCVVDLPAVCAAGQRLWHDDSRISFRNTMPDASEQFDIVYSWSAVQYVPQPIKLIEQFASYNPTAILFVGTPFTARSAFVRRQKSVSGAFPAWVLSVPEVERALAARHYHLAFNVAHIVDQDVDAYAPIFRVPNTAALLFLKETA